MNKHQLLFDPKDKDKFDNIESGRKTVETRAYSPAYAEIKDDDLLEIVCGQDVLYKRVVSAAKYTSVDEMFKAIDYKLVSPEAESKQVAAAVYKSFPGYSERIAKDGIFAFTLSSK